jgi:hypothetical protein
MAERLVVFLLFLGAILTFFAPAPGGFAVGCFMLQRDIAVYPMSARGLCRNLPDLAIRTTNDRTNGNVVKYEILMLLYRSWYEGNP